MTCTEEYQERIEYTFHAFCKVVIRNAMYTALRTRSRKNKREISLDYLTEEKHYPLGTEDEYFILLHTGVKGAEFYDKMRLSSFPGNRVRQEAEEILKGGLANFDVESYKGYKSKFNDIYREEAYALLNVIIEMLG